jgi:molecular chaperone HtpG
LGDLAADVRASERLTDSAVCLVAPEHAMDRHLEMLLARAGQVQAAAKPILEINPRHPLILRLASLDEEEGPLREDAARLLFDEARIADGEAPVDPRGFSARLARVISRATG